jgi:hypothetical protein
LRKIEINKPTIIPASIEKMVGFDFRLIFIVFDCRDLVYFCCAQSTNQVIHIAQPQREIFIFFRFRA